MKIILSFLLLIIFSFTITHPPVKKSALYKPELNHLENTKFNKNFNFFIEKLHDIKQGEKRQLNIMHIGGSHIQGDFMTNALRKKMIKFSPNKTSRGIVFPYRVAHTNKSVGYNTTYNGNWTSCKNSLLNRHCTLGLMGISVTTSSENANINFDFNTRKGQYPFNYVRIMHGKIDGNTEITWDKKDEKFRFLDKSKKITFVIFKNHKTSFSLKISNKNGAKFTLFGLDFGSDGTDLRVHNVGVNGARIQSFTHSKLFSEQLAYTPADAVIFSLGLNDVYKTNFDTNDFKNHFELFVNEIKNSNKSAAIIITTISDHYKKGKVNKNTAVANKILRRIAYKYDCVIWDWFKICKGQGSIKKWEKNNMAKPDRVHFTKSGYKLLGNLLYKSIEEVYMIRYGKK